MSLMVKSEESLECFSQLDVLSYEEAKSAYDKLISAKI